MTRTVCGLVASCVRVLKAGRGLLAAIALAALAFPATAQAAEQGQVRLGDDYAQFHIGGADWQPCERECNADASCRSWMYITAIGQCRLKHSVPPAAANACCVSGTKEAVAPAASRDPDEAECARLTEAAVEANNQNLRSRCGLTGPLWSSAYDEMYSRCLDASPRRRQREVDDRKQALQVCRQTADASGGLVCDHYARMAVAENVTNTTNNCGLSGPEWSADAEAHQQFCRHAQRSGVLDRISAREQQLQECLNRGGAADDHDCQAFADQSVNQFVQAAKLRCGDGFSGPGWSRDAAEHYKWCRGHSHDQRVAVIQQRQDALESCDRNRIDLRQLFNLKDLKF